MKPTIEQRVAAIRADADKIKERADRAFKTGHFEKACRLAGFVAKWRTYADKLASQSQ